MESRDKALENAEFVAKDMESRKLREAAKCLREGIGETTTVFRQVGVSCWGWCRFVGLVVDSITTNHATRPSSRRRSMMLMPNSVLIRLSRYQTM